MKLVRDRRPRPDHARQRKKDPKRTDKKWVGRHGSRRQYVRAAKEMPCVPCRDSTSTIEDGGTRRAEPQMAVLSPSFKEAEATGHIAKA